MSKPFISHHHGTCDLCNKEHIVVLMFGYGQGIDAHYSICKDCFAEHVQQIIYGFHNYKDGLIN